MRILTDSLRRAALSRGVVLAAAAIALCLGLAACAPQATPSTEAGTGEAAAEMTSEDGMYESDEKCLSCHGGSYEALASTTADYGLSNPHDSVHGGYNPCANCHARDKEVTDNQCTKCHSWPHNPTEGPLATTPAA